MIVTMHQPEHLPWLGYFHKMAQADLYVVIDSCQYRHQYFQNRNRILGAQGPIWVKVPVIKEQTHYGPIDQLRIDDGRNWRHDYWNSIYFNYNKHPYFKRYAPDLEAILMAPWEKLAELNLVLIDFFRECLNIRTPMVRSSRLQAPGAKGELLLNICQEVGATEYLSGPFGRDYLDPDAFRAAGVTLRFHDFRHPEYAQAKSQAFVPQLSTLDLLMNHGPESAEILLRPAATHLLAH